MKFKNAYEIRRYLQKNYTVGDVIKLEHSDGYEFIATILPNYDIKIIWDNFSVANKEDGTYETWVYDYNNINMCDDEYSYYRISHVG